MCRRRACACRACRDRSRRLRARRDSSSGSCSKPSPCACRRIVRVTGSPTWISVGNSLSSFSSIDSAGSHGSRRSTSPASACTCSCTASERALIVRGAAEESGRIGGVERVAAEHERGQIERAALLGRQRVVAFHHVIAAVAERREIALVLTEPLHDDAVGLRLAEIAVGEAEREIELDRVAHLLLHVRRSGSAVTSRNTSSPGLPCAPAGCASTVERDRRCLRAADRERGNRDAARVLRFEADGPDASSRCSRR